MFKKNSAELKTLIGNIIVVVIATAATLFSSGNGFGISHSALGDFPLYLGLSALGVGLLDIPIAIVLFIAGESDYGKGFLISAGILLLVSGITCGGFAMMG